jgi:Heat shock protein
MAPVAGREPTLNLGPGTVTGSAGCSGYGSQGLTIERATIHIRDLGMQAACPDERLMIVEAAFFAALRDADRFEFRNAQLVLSGASGELVFDQLPGPE